MMTMMMRGEDDDVNDDDNNDRDVNDVQMNAKLHIEVDFYVELRVLLHRLL